MISQVAVMAGTPIDTKMGSDLLRKNNLNDIIEIPISKNPSEQTVFQTSSEEIKESIINFHIEKMKKQNCEILFVYCNSLSGAVDFEKIAKEQNIQVITPMNIYSEIAKKYERIGVISANAQGLSGIERVMFQNNENIEVVGITLLEMVKEIEKKTKAEEIAEMFNFDMLVKYFEYLKLKHIVIGCTHFPYIKSEIKKRTTLGVIDPSEKMIEKILKLSH